MTAMPVPSIRCAATGFRGPRRPLASFPAARFGPAVLRVARASSGAVRRRLARSCSHPAGFLQAAAAHTPVRLTRRGRFLFLGVPALVVATVLASSATILLAGALAAGSSSPAHAATLGSAEQLHAGTVTVLPGESLWSVAVKSDPTRDPRDVIGDIVALNGLTGGIVHPGQQILVPLRR